MEQNETKLVESAEMNLDIDLPSGELPSLVLHRVPNGKGDNGKQFYRYCVKGIVRNHEVVADFVPKDKGGYEVLDIVYDTENTATLVMKDEVMVDNAGKRQHYTTYKAVNVDEDGIAYECEIRPERKSDRDFLAMLLKKINKPIIH